MALVNERIITLDDFSQLQALLDYEQQERDKHILQCQHNRPLVAPSLHTRRHQKFHRAINPQASLQSSLERARLAEASMKLKKLRTQYKRRRTLEVQIYLDNYRRQALVRAVLPEEEELYYRQCIAAALEARRVQACLQEYIEIKRLQDMQNQIETQLFLANQEPVVEDETEGYDAYRTLQLEAFLRQLFNQQVQEEYEVPVKSELEEAEDMAEVWKLLSNQKADYETPRSAFLAPDHDVLLGMDKNLPNIGQNQNKSDNLLGRQLDIENPIDQVFTRQEQVEAKKSKEQPSSKYEALPKCEDELEKLLNQVLTKGKVETEPIFLDKPQVELKMPMEPVSLEKPQAELKLPMEPVSLEKPQAELKMPIEPVSLEKPQAELKMPTEPVSLEKPQAELKMPKKHVPLEKEFKKMDQVSNQSKMNETKEQQDFPEKNEAKKNEELKETKDIHKPEEHVKEATEVHKHKEHHKESKEIHKPNDHHKAKKHNHSKKNKSEAEADEKKPSSDKVTEEINKNHKKEKEAEEKKEKEVEEKKEKEAEEKKKDVKEEESKQSNEANGKSFDYDIDFPPLQSHVVPLQDLIQRLASEPVLIGEQQTHFSDEPKPSGIWAKKSHVKSPPPPPLSTQTEEKKATFLPQHIFTEAEPTPTLENMPNTPLGQEEEGEESEHFVNSVAAEQKNEVVPPEPKKIKMLEELESVRHQLEDDDSEIVKRWKHVMQGGDGGNQHLEFSKQQQGTLVLTASTPFNRQFLGSEDELVRTLIRLDAIDSMGDESIRKQRKSLVKTCESMLDKLDAYKQTQWEKAIVK